MEPNATPRLHLAFLDGIRGLMALCVLLYHYQVVLDSRIGLPAQPVFSFIRWLSSYGGFAVSVFIVLSGYVLMLPVARSTDKVLRNGVGEFVKRRARRIFPAYYGALLLFSGLILASRLLHLPNDFVGQLTLRSFADHALLIHNWTDSFFLIDPPMWSLAMEWQIYFVYALVLLPLYRRFGIGATVALSFLGSVPIGLFSPEHFALTSPWFVGLFTLGMLGAHWQYDQSAFGEKVRALRWGYIALACAGVGLIVHPYIPHDRSVSQVAVIAALDIVVGIGALGLIMHGTRAALSGNVASRNRVLSFWQSRFLMGVGAFSYSLYLFHMPVIDYMAQAIRHFHAPAAVTATVLFLCLPLVVGITYICYRVFEKPFLSK